MEEEWKRNEKSMKVVNKARKIIWEAKRDLLKMLYTRRGKERCMNKTQKVYLSRHIAQTFHMLYEDKFKYGYKEKAKEE